MLTLFHAPRSRSTRILWLLEELGADYAVRHVGIRYLDGSGAGLALPGGLAAELSAKGSP